MKRKAVLGLGIGIPLGAVILTDPAAASDFGGDAEITDDTSFGNTDFFEAGLGSEYPDADVGNNYAVAQTETSRPVSAVDADDGFSITLDESHVGLQSDDPFQTSFEPTFELVVADAGTVSDSVAVPAATHVDAGDHIAEGVVEPEPEAGVGFGAYWSKLVELASEPKVAADSESRQELDLVETSETAVQPDFEEPVDALPEGEEELSLVEMWELAVELEAEEQAESLPDSDEELSLMEMWELAVALEAADLGGSEWTDGGTVLAESGAEVALEVKRDENGLISEQTLAYNEVDEIKGTVSYVETQDGNGTRTGLEERYYTEDDGNVFVAYNGEGVETYRMAEKGIPGGLFRTKTIDGITTTEKETDRGAGSILIEATDENGLKTWRDRMVFEGKILWENAVDENGVEIESTEFVSNGRLVGGRASF